MDGGRWTVILKLVSEIGSLIFAYGFFRIRKRSAECVETFGKFLCL
jgi:hypothetical protein